MLVVCEKNYEVVYEAYDWDDCIMCEHIAVCDTLEEAERIAGKKAEVQKLERVSDDTWERSKGGWYESVSIEAIYDERGECKE